MTLPFKYKRRLLTRPCCRRERPLAVASVTKPPLRLTCVRHAKRSLPISNLLFLVSF